MNDRSLDFSPLAKQYASSRPGYPAELFMYLASLVPEHRLAWDCATGNGQAALELIKHFDRVIATDISSEQIKHAVPHPKITYRVASAEQSGLKDHSVDLVTVGAAIHWFDLDAFYVEVQRVVPPGGVLAAWTYHVGHVEPPFDRIFHDFYYNVLLSYFGQGARLVDQRYETIVLPGVPLKSKDFWVTAEWKFDQMIAFIRSWSGTRQYTQERNEDPVAPIEAELESIWGDRESVHTVRWPLYVRISRL